MGLMDAHHHDEPSHDTHGAAQTKRRLGVMIAAAVVLLAGYFVVFRPKPAPERPPATTPVEQARSDDEAASQPKAEAPETTSPAPRTPRKGAAPVAEPVPAAPEPLGPVLLVNSDVPGASVFVDRKYLGTTPLTTREVTQGTHQLNASAEGHDGIVQTIEVAGSGETSITLKFREVRLDESVAVVHKHGMGACEGRLAATAAGLRYETSNKGDAFSLPFAELEVFEIDYLEKTLRVKKRAGKTWNFTDRSENADTLFVFHRDVTKARTKLASQ